MDIIIKATNIQLTPYIKKYVDTKIGSLARFLKRIEPSLLIARVEVGKPSRHHKKGNVFYAEVSLQLPGKALRAQAQNWDLHLAIDEIKNEMQRQIKDYKEKQETARRNY